MTINTKEASVMKPFTVPLTLSVPGTGTRTSECKENTGNAQITQRKVVLIL
jgi:hypothetical protein